MPALESTALTISRANYAQDPIFKHLHPEGPVIWDLDILPKDHTITKLFVRAHGSGTEVDLGTCEACTPIDNTTVAKKISLALAPHAVVYLESCYSDNNPDSLAEKIRSLNPSAIIYGFKTESAIASKTYDQKYLMEGPDWSSSYFPFAESNTCSTTATTDQMLSYKEEFKKMQERLQEQNEDLNSSGLIDFFDKHQSALFCHEKDTVLNIQLIQMHYNLLVNESVNEIDWNPTVLFQYRLLLNSLPKSLDQTSLFASFEKLIITKSIHLFNGKKFDELENLFGQPSYMSRDPICWQKNRKYDSLHGLEVLLKVQAFSDEKISTKRILDYAQDQNVYKQTLLMISIRHEWPDELIQQIILNSGVNIDAQDNYKDTALIIATREGRTEVVKALLRASAQVNIQNDVGYTALMYATQKETAEALLEANPSDQVDIQNNYGYTALMIAANQGYTEIARALLRASAQVNIQNNQKGTTQGYTALLYAALFGRTEIAKALLDAGAHYREKALKLVLKESKPNPALVEILSQADPK
ncbi:MAG: ankyrin repeat domain-containing protein [Chlamydiae bacterium]|nr:ankyrin repeat domain-containing protein [Chlamydiota bacterium]